MKRTVAGAVLIAGLGSGCVSTKQDTGVAEGAKPFGYSNGARVAPGLRGPLNEPVHISGPAAVTAAGQMPGEKPTRAEFRGDPGKMGGVSQAAGFARVLGHKSGGVSVPGVGGCSTGDCGGMAYGGAGYGTGLPATGPTTNGFREAIGHGAGILPVPAMGPWGAVAAIGANGPGSGMYGGLYMNGRTSVRFVNPAGMKIGWQTAPGVFSDSGLEAPARYNFAQMQTYRLRLSSIPNLPGRNFYPTLEVYPATRETVTYLSHATVPLSFTPDDFEQAISGSLVTKVIYLPSERFQDLAAVAGAEEIVSTRLDPGVDPVAEANRRGTILCVIRFGNIDLQDPNTPAPDAPTNGMMGLPPGAVPTGPAMPAPTMPSAMPGSSVVPGVPVTPSRSAMPSGVKPTTPGTLPAFNAPMLPK